MSHNVCVSLEIKSTRQREELANTQPAGSARASAPSNDAPGPPPKRRRNHPDPDASEVSSEYPPERRRHRDSPPRPRGEIPAPVVVYAGHMQPNPPLQSPQYQQIMTPRRSPFIAPVRGPAPPYAYNHVLRGTQ